MTMELADETDDEEQVLAMQGELLTRCLLHLHGILHLGDLLTLRSRGSLGRHNVVGFWGFGWRREP